MMFIYIMMLFTYFIITLLAFTYHLLLIIIIIIYLYYHYYVFIYYYCKYSLRTITVKMFSSSSLKGSIKIFSDCICCSK